MNDNNFPELQHKICCLLPPEDFEKIPLLLEISREEGAKYLQIICQPMQDVAALEPLVKDELRLIIGTEYVTTKAIFEKKLGKDMDEISAFLEATIQIAPFAVDLAIEMGEKRLKELFALAEKNNVRTILSKQYTKYPSLAKIQKDLQALQQYRPFISKIICPIETKTQAQSLLCLYRENSNEKIIVLGSGPEGKVTQLLAPVLGAEFTYAYLTRKQPEAQIAVNYLHRTLMAMKEVL